LLLQLLSLKIIAPPPSLAILLSLSFGTFNFILSFTFFFYGICSNIWPALIGIAINRRIHKSQPKTLELLQLSATKDFPGTTGLRITFPHALCPFAYVCQNQSQVLV
jgi:hypothetical protein